MVFNPYTQTQTANSLSVGVGRRGYSSGGDVPSSNLLQLNGKTLQLNGNNLILGSA